MKLFALNASRNFGQLVADEIGIALSEHEERDFEDGEHKVRPLVNVRNEDVFVLQSLYSDNTQSVNDKLCRLLFFIGALKDASAAKITAVMPYLCYARKDRKTQPRDPLTLRYIAQLFEAVGTQHVVTMDVHNLQSFQNSFRCSTDHLEARRFFVDQLGEVFNDDDVTIMSPDIGGAKRAEQLQQSMNKRFNKHLPLLFMQKHRSGGQIWGDDVTGNVKGKTIMIIDDLISTGGTIIRCANACKKGGARQIYALATHGLFTGQPDQILLEAPIDKLFVTNTIPLFRLHSLELKNKITVLNVAPLFASAIHCLNTGCSVTGLLNH